MSTPTSPNQKSWKSDANLKVTHFTFQKKVVKNNSLTSKELITAFCTVQSQNWKKPLQSVHMAWLFRAQKPEEKNALKNKKQNYRVQKGQ